MFSVGMKVTSRLQPNWGIGHVLAVEELRATVAFAGMQDKPTMVSTKTLERVRLTGDVRLKDGHGEVVSLREGKELWTYVVRIDGEEVTVSEADVFGPEPVADVVSAFEQGEVGDARDYVLRRSALRLDDERRYDALGAMLASRVRVQPHQIGVVQRALSASAPRFILADEVGLGKTIEAGMVFSALRLGGLVRRALVVAPNHLTVQWLVELEHKFNQRFSLIDGVDDWEDATQAIVSLELLQRSEEHREAAAANEWDLVIIDEAHHLRGARAFEAASLLAKQTWGLLLLTATPMQLDPLEYQRLLTLIDEERAPSVQQLQTLMEQQQAVSDSVRALRDPAKSAQALKDLAKRFANDPGLQGEPEAVLAHLAETYSLSESLVRNRRAVVGGFAQRQLCRHPVTALGADKWKQAEGSGVVLQSAIHKLEAPLKLDAFGDLVERIWRDEPGAKILVFCQAKDTLDALIAKLQFRGIEALGYYGELGLVERDRHVARFRDPEGPKVLVCTEVGSEGRNFQFAHHLICYDLPWSPSVVEQRIGRLDRIGQTKPIMIHVFDVVGSFGSIVLDVLDDGVGVFAETIGGLDAVLEEVEGGLMKLAANPSDVGAYVAALKERVRQARDRTRQGYDPLLDERSFDTQGLQALLARAEGRMQIEADGESLTDRFWVVARDLEERLEETATALARRIGINVDTDDEVDAFQCAFHFGYAANVDALPGLNIHDDRTVLGTFWRETALEQEEIDYFATGHPIVEALFGMLRDGPFGRLAAAKVHGKKLPPFGFLVTFHLEHDEPADTHPGARVPSRQLSRFLGSSLIDVCLVPQDGELRLANAAMIERFDAAKKEHLNPEELRHLAPAIAKLAAEVSEAARTEAQARLVEEIIPQAEEAIDAEAAVRKQRLARALAHQGMRADTSREDAAYTAIRDSASRLQLALDSICVWVTG